jgi:hypothetical protein
LSEAIETHALKHKQKIKNAVVEGSPNPDFKRATGNFCCLIEVNEAFLPNSHQGLFWVAFVIQALHWLEMLSQIDPFCPKMSRTKDVAQTIG